MQDQVYQLFSTCDKFTEVGHDAAAQSSKGCSNSLESIHNTIHTTAGGPGTKTVVGGHMTYLSTAAFDPVFWLHHTNVDRFFALWQALHPDSYSGSQVAPHNTWTIAKGTTQNLDSPLTPFHKDASGNFWTTNEVRHTNTFHYTYPEFADSDGSKKAIASYVNKLYGPSATATAGSSKRTALPEPVVASALIQARDPTPLVASNGSLFQYVANIRTPRYALNGTYNIYLFNSGPTSEDPASWILDPNLIGPMGVLAQEDSTGNKNVIAAGSVPLTRTLSNEVATGTLSNLTEAIVVPYLKNELEWRVAGPDGQEVDPNTIPDFDISVYASTSSPVSDYELPTWSAFVLLTDVTKDKAGGATAPPPMANSTISANLTSSVSSSMSSASASSTATLR